MSVLKWRERGFKAEHKAQAERRTLIESYHTVSLIAYDPQRDLYVFDYVPTREGV